MSGREEVNYVWIGYARTIACEEPWNPKAPAKSAAQLQITPVSEYVEIHTLNFCY
jgi:hypothetical protein